MRKPKKTLTSRSNQAGDRVSEFKDKVEDTDKIRNKYKTVLIK